MFLKNKIVESYSYFSWKPVSLIDKEDNKYINEYDIFVEDVYERTRFRIPLVLYIKNKGWYSIIKGDFIDNKLFKVIAYSKVPNPVFISDIINDDNKILNSDNKIEQELKTNLTLN